MGEEIVEIICGNYDNNIQSKSQIVEINPWLNSGNLT